MPGTLGGGGGCGGGGEGSGDEGGGGNGGGGGGGTGRGGLGGGGGGGGFGSRDSAQLTGSCFNERRLGLVIVYRLWPRTSESDDR